MNTTADTPTWSTWPATLATVVVAVVVGAGIASGLTPVLIASVGVAMLALAYGWVRLLRLPSPRGTTAVLTSAGLLVVAGGLFSRETHVSLMPAAVALALLLEFGHQLGRRDRRPRLVESVSSSVFGIALVTSGACFLVLDDPVGRSASLVAVAGALVSAPADLLRHATVRAGAATLLGAVAGWAVWGLVGPDQVSMHVEAAALAGALAGLASSALRRGMGALPTIGGFRARWAAGAASVLAVGVVAYALAWGIIGSLDPLLQVG
ncbi:MAG: hypothetical protein Q4G51_05440 [Dermatophilus congolensis]|nr:hypothetical protein [Dermatophilus congolensis]